MLKDHENQQYFTLSKTFVNFQSLSPYFKLMPVSEHLPELLRLFLYRVSVHPSKTAYLFIEDHGNTQELSYEELYLRASAIAQKLIKDKIEGPKRALLIYSPGFDFIISLFACFLSNTTAIPIAIPRPRTKTLFQHFLSHACPHYILTTASLEQRVKKLMEPNPASVSIFLTTDAKEKAKEGFIPPVSINKNALIQYTSGTTTKPKGVIITFENLAHNLQAIKDHFQLNEKSVCFSWLPHFHDMGLIDGILTPIFNDCIGILCSPLNVISNPLNWLQAISQYRVTHTGGPNFFFDLCTIKVTKLAIKGIDLRSLSHLYVSAEPVRKQTLKKFASTFQSCGFHENLFTPGYGLAEATLMVTCKPINSPLHYWKENNQDQSEEYVGLGKPIAEVCIKIIDTETLEEQSDNKPGEVCLRGPSLSTGYYNDPEATTNAFVYLPENGKMITYFRTGDIGILAKDELFVIGRLKDVLLIRGLKYPPEDLEYVVSGSHPAIQAMSSVVFSIEHDNEQKIIVLQEREKMDDRSLYLEIRNCIADSIYQSFGLSVFDIILLPKGRILKTTSGKMMRSDNCTKYLKGEFQHDEAS